jgi:hypothetical protein
LLVDVSSYVQQLNNYLLNLNLIVAENPQRVVGCCRGRRGFAAESGAGCAYEKLHVHFLKIRIK